jgi:MtrB/PioB family decaheme-associated outer membrane protein
VTVGFDKLMSGGFDVQVRVRNEQKDGERVFGRGTTGTGFQFTPEPLNSSTSQVEAILGYTGKQLQLSGGYYGSLYDNHNTALNVTETGVATGLATFTPIGLPPDNQAHQLYLAGGYSFTPSTRSTFKLAYASATQTDTFITPSLLGDPSLDGRVDTTQAQLGVTSRPLPKLSLLANVRYEDRDDKTPVRLYSSLAGATSTFNGYYEPRSIKTTAGKLEAGYQLPWELRLLGGVDYEVKERLVPYWFGGSLASVSTRAETDEITYRLQLQRALAESVNGYLSYAHSDRDGTGYLTTVLNNGTVGTNLIAPLHLADRSRDKVRVAVDWMPTDRLTFQLAADSARDDYTARTAEDLGPRNGDAKTYSLDASYLFSDAWQATAWVSRNDNRTEQATCENASAVGVCPNTVADPYWQVSMRSASNAVGLGLRSKPASKLEISADVQYSSYRDEFKQLATTAGASISSPPDITTLITTVKLTARYAIRTNAGIRVDYAYERWHSDDWTWSTWTYLDGTQLRQEPTEKIQFVGVSGYFRWW